MSNIPDGLTRERQIRRAERIKAELADLIADASASPIAAAQLRPLFSSIAEVATEGRKSITYASILRSTCSANT